MKFRFRTRSVLSAAVIFSLLASFLAPFETAFAIAAPISNPSTTVSLSPVKDTWVEQDAATTNHGTESVMSVKSFANANGSNKQNRRSLIAFSFSSIPANAIISSATLSLYMSDAPSQARTLDLMRVATDWVEGNGGTNNNPVGEVRWDNQPATSSPIITSFPVGTSPAAVSVDVTAEVAAIIAGAPSHGWQIADHTENASGGGSRLARFRTREYGDEHPNATELSQRPKLTITYTLPAPVYTGAVSGTVFQDLNGNGVKDSGESFVEGRTITLVGGAEASSTMTDASGAYHFAGLQDGTYRVCETLPVTNPAWQQTFPTSGADCTGTFGYDAVVTSGGSVTDQSFGDIQPAFISVTKITEPSDSTEVFGFTGDLATDEGDEIGNGESVSQVVLPGSYTSTESGMTGWDLTSLVCDSGATGNLETKTVTFTPAPGQHVNCTFTNTERASIHIDNQTNPNEGTFGFAINGPTSLPGVSILGNGGADFSNLVPGNYTLTETLPSGWSGDESASCTVDGSPVDPRSSVLTLAPGSDVSCTYNHGQYGVIKGAVFNDKNQNGIKDKHEGNLNNWFVDLFAVPSEPVEGTPTPLRTVQSTKHGYLFNDLEPGLYTVCERVKTLWNQTGPTTGSECTNGTIGYQLDLRAGEIKSEGTSFGNYRDGSIFGRVFEDKNANGLRDKKEPWLQNQTVSLLVDGSVTETAMTDSHGRYQFTHVTPGTYTLRVTVPGGWVETAPVGDYTVTVSSNEQIRNKRFGLYHDVTLPTLSVGFGNGNSPANTGPEHGAVEHTPFPVYASFQDQFPAGFHLRVVKDGGNQGHSCGASLGDESNQGYDKCGYVFNMVVSTTTSFTDQLLTTLDPAQFPGDGDYWIIIGAIDQAGNRTAADYLNDPKVKVTIDTSVPADTTAPEVPTLLSPADGSVKKPAGLILDWSDVTDSSAPVTYIYQSSLSSATGTGNALTSPIYTSGSLASSQIDASGSADNAYYWQVKACDNASNCSAWTPPWLIVVDSVAPVSVISSPNEDSDFEDAITISGTTTDLNGVASTTLAYAVFHPGEGDAAGYCDESYTNITTLDNASHSTSFEWSTVWTPADDGAYCIKAHGLDLAGNAEASPKVANVRYKKPATPTPVTPPQTTSSTGGSNGGGGNGPIAGTYGLSSSGSSGGTSGGSTGGSNGGSGSGSTGGTPNTPSSSGEQTALVAVNSPGQTGGQTGGQGGTGTGGQGTGQGSVGGIVLGTEGSTTASTTIDNNSDQLASVVAGGSRIPWKVLLWILLILLIIGIIIFVFRRKNKNN